MRMVRLNMKPQKSRIPFWWLLPPLDEAAEHYIINIARWPAWY